MQLFYAWWEGDDDISSASSPKQFTSLSSRLLHCQLSVSIIIRNDTTTTAVILIAILAFSFELSLNWCLSCRTQLKTPTLLVNCQFTLRMMTYDLHARCLKLFLYVIWFCLYICLQKKYNNFYPTKDHVLADQGK